MTYEHGETCNSQKELIAVFLDFYCPAAS